MENGKPKSNAKKEKKDVVVSADPKPVELAFGSAEALAKGYKQYMTLTCEQIGRLYPAAADQLGELAEFGKGNIDAWILAGSKAAEGWESLTSEIMGYNSKIWDQTVKRTEALFGCTDLSEVVSLQSDAVREQLDALIAEGSKLQEMTAAAASAAVEPINERLGKAADQLTKPIAA